MKRNQYGSPGIVSSSCDNAATVPLRTLLRSPLRSLCPLFLAAALTPAAAAQAPAQPLQVAVTNNILYTTDSTGNYSADLYTPAGQGPFPAIVMIHGGSWRSGHKTELKRLANDLAAHGYVCFSIDYDTHPHSFPYSWQESRAAVAFVRVHAAAYGVDPDRIATLGTSAGGQLAALLAVAPRGPAVPQGADAPGGEIAVEAAVLFNGGYDARPSAWVLRRYLGGRCAKIPQICADASPDSHVVPGAPPVYVGHGTHDGIIPYSQATDFIALLQKAGDPVTPFAATGGGHSYWRAHKWYTPNLAAAEAFLATAMPKEQGQRQTQTPFGSDNQGGATSPN